ncbi:MAG: DnaB-like helicase C-terminal domain-containing protein [Bdellovibrionaceae bacterium]|nr:DnaB-like helicase C-terminal domain-containing protein [Pseudobdellovibrionaceae bacterium]
MKRRDFLQILTVAPMAVLGAKYMGGTETLPKDLPKTLLQPELKVNANSSKLVSVLANLNLGDHVIIAGRPSMGKTSVALNFMTNLACVENKACAYFSIEQSKEALMTRMLAICAEVPKASIARGKLSDEQFDKITIEAGVISDSNIFIDDTAGITVAEISRRLSRLKKSGVDAKYVFIDYLQLLKSDLKHDCRRDEVESIIAQLKQLALDQNVIMVTLAQLNRGVEARSDRRPLLTDLREFRFEQSAPNIDKVVLLYRDDYYDKSLQTKNIELIVARDKKEKCLTYVAKFDNSTLKISKFELMQSNDSSVHYRQRS